MPSELDDALAVARNAHEKGDLETAVRGYGEIIRRQDSYAEAWHLLGIAFSDRGEFEKAVGCIERAIELFSTMGASVSNGSEGASGRTETSKTLGWYYQNLGDAYCGLGKHEEANSIYLRSLEFNPRSAITWNNRGTLLLGCGYIEEASNLFKKAMAVELGIDLEQKNDRTQTIDRLIALARDQRLSSASRRWIAMTANNLGCSYTTQGLLEEAMEMLGLAADLDPAASSYLSNWLMTSNYLPQIEDSELQRRHMEWRDRFCSSANTVAYQNQREPNRKLRIGYVSPDFRLHAVNSFFESFYQYHQLSEVEPILYSECRTQDEVSQRLKTYSYAWRNTYGITDEQMVQQIRQDEIDVFIDLAGHSANNRLAVLAKRPAPIQLSYLGYPGTTALAQEMFTIVDEHLEPKDTHFFNSNHRYLNPCFCCYSPDRAMPDVGESPAQKCGYITFGMFHGLFKLNSEVLDVWSDVLRAIPTSRLFLFRNALRGESLKRIRRAFECRGVSETRIDLQSEFDVKLGHCALYHRVDITLDSFPWSGHTTCTEALWMGVPVVTLYGQRHAGRMVASVLNAIGCSEWIANSKQEYVEKAIALATDPANLAKHRQTLRSRMVASQLCDGPGFAKKLETFYRQLWHEWLGKVDHF